MKVSVIMPVYNGETTLKETLDSLFEQREYFQEFIAIDDVSKDNSKKIIEKFIAGKEDCELISNKKNMGLARSYNLGIRKAKGDLIVTIHQDILLEENALQNLIAPFADEKVVAAGHADIHPRELWKKYNFWQKCYFSRFMKRDGAVGINGQFDCFRKSALFEVDLFDEVHFRSAGEDGDIVYNLKKIGKVAESGARTIHIHKIDPNFSWRDILKKQKQYSEAQGALLARGRIFGACPMAASFFREILLIALFFPYVRILSALLIVIYSLVYTKLVYLKEYKDPRILVLPLFNIFLLFVGFAYSLKGFILGKQTI